MEINYITFMCAPYTINMKNMQKCYNTSFVQTQKGFKFKLNSSYNTVILTLKSPAYLTQKVIMSKRLFF